VLDVRAAETGAKVMLLKAMLFVAMKGIYSEVGRITFLGAFANLRKANISFMSFRPHGKTPLPRTDFDETWYLSFFRKIGRENSSFIETRQE
jgi:hypothetical protein